VNKGADLSTGLAAPKFHMGKRQQGIAGRGQGAGQGRTWWLIAVCDRSDLQWQIRQDDLGG